MRRTVWICLLFLAIVPAQHVAAQDPGWQVNASDFQFNMNVTAAVYKDGIKIADPNDALGAFVGDQVRGVARPILVNNEPVFFLTIHGNTNGESITFKIFDSESNAVLDVDQSIAFLGNAIIGQPSDPFRFVVETDVNDPLAWTIEPSNFSLNMEVVARVRLDGIELDDPDALIAAFVGSEVRGVAGPSASALSLFFLTVYANDESETITMRVSSPARDTVFAVAGAFEFASNTQLGDENTPFGLDGGSTTDVNSNAWLTDLAVDVYPIPTRDQVRIRLQTTSTGTSILRIFDIRGREVSSPEIAQGPGDQTITWTTVDDAGRALPAGLYFARLSSGERSTTHRIVLVR